MPPTTPDCAAQAWSPAAIAAAYARAPAAAGSVSAAARPSALRIEAVDATGSTNADLVARAAQAAPQQPVLRAALVQRAGRGRLGRSWHAERGAGLLFSVALPLAAAPASGLTLACGVALAQALQAIGVPVGLKWPNDLLLDGGKLAGVLAEATTDGAGRRSVVVGVGLNLFGSALPPGDGGVGSPPATAPLPRAALVQRLAPAAVVAGRDALLGTLAAAVVDAVLGVQQTGFAPWRTRFDALFVLRGAAVHLVQDGRELARGEALGAGEHGELMLRTSEGVRHFASGELSLRPAGGA